ncbi:MAG: peptidase [Leeuwenhoekiella sp.]|nr:MAG: peptidase [Leeuwenhoekiella sp.]
MKKQFLLFVTGVSLVISCQTDEVTSEVEEIQTENLEITAQTISKIKSLSLNSDDVETITTKFPDGKIETSYLVEGDIAISKSQLESMKVAKTNTKQYRTYNLVESPRVIEVTGYAGNGDPLNLTPKQLEALEAAIDNYNDLGIGLTFNLTITSDIPTLLSGDTYVFQNPNGQAGGVAGFPSAGNPFGTVQIFSGMEAFSLQVNTHVITHELGHTVGLRHTDWFTRQSCGRPSFGELANPNGAVHIPGTPYGFDPTSIMLSCFSTRVTGEFGPNDIVALNYLY